MSASVNFPLHYKVQKFSSGIGSRGCSRKKGHKMVVVVDIFVNDLYATLTYKRHSTVNLLYYTKVLRSKCCLHDRVDQSVCVHV